MAQPLRTDEYLLKEHLRGGLPVFKPKGLSSFDVIRKLKGYLPRKTRMGHAGTLDPAAQGLLLILVNEATRVQHLCKDFDKEYIAEIKLGTATDTDDMEGKITRKARVPDITTQRIEKVLPSLCGTRMQKPPRYSALKVDGKRAYAKARSGEDFDLPARQVTIFSLELISWESPVIKIKAEVSSGTYIRSLAREIGKGLDVPACLYSLIRTRIGNISAENPLNLENLSAENINSSMIPVLELIDHLPRAEISRAEAAFLLQGKPLDADAHTELLSSPLSVLYPADRTQAFLCEPRNGRLCSRRLLFSNGSEDEEKGI